MRDVWELGVGVVESFGGNVVVGGGLLGRWEQRMGRWVCRSEEVVFGGPSARSCILRAA